MKFNSLEEFKSYYLQEERDFDNYDWKVKYLKINTFILENKKFPSYNNTNYEKKLYEYLKEELRLYKLRKIKKEKKILFEDILNLHKNFIKKEWLDIIDNILEKFILQSKNQNNSEFSKIQNYMDLISNFRSELSFNDFEIKDEYHYLCNIIKEKNLNDKRILLKLTMLLYRNYPIEKLLKMAKSGYMQYFRNTKVNWFINTFLKEIEHLNWSSEIKKTLDEINIHIELDKKNKKDFELKQKKNIEKETIIFTIMKSEEFLNYIENKSIITYDDLIKLKSKLTEITQNKNNHILDKTHLEKITILENQFKHIINENHYLIENHLKEKKDKLIRDTNKNIKFIQKILNKNKKLNTESTKSEEKKLYDLLLSFRKDLTLIVNEEIYPEFIKWHDVLLNPKDMKDFLIRQEINGRINKNQLAEKLSVNTKYQNIFIEVNRDDFNSDISRDVIKNISFHQVKLPFVNLKIRIIENDFKENLFDITCKDNKISINFQKILIVISIFEEKLIKNIFSNIKDQETINLFYDLISVLMYLTRYEHNSEIVITESVIARIKKQNKNEKNFNTVYIDFSKKYINNDNFSQGYYEQRKSMVRGHWRKQPIGSRDSIIQKYKLIWIMPFWKGSNDIIENKLYKLT